MMKALIYAAVVLVVLICVRPPGVAAHGVGYSLVESDSTVAIHVFYATGEPMAYGEAVVFAPEGGDQHVAYQSGRTDANGVFCFLPDKSGAWEVKVMDGRGHGATAVVDVTGAGVKPLGGTGHPSRLLGALLGVSLLGNALWGWGLWERRETLAIAGKAA